MNSSISGKMVFATIQKFNDLVFPYGYRHKIFKA